MRALLMFVAGFVVASALVVPSSAQSMPASGKTYIETTIERLGTIDNLYTAANDYFFSRGTAIAVTKAHQAVIEAVEDIDRQEPPIALLGLHAQMKFAALRCANMATGPKDPNNATQLEAIIFMNSRSSCLSEFHAARLRLIDYAAGYGVNPFE